MATPQIFISYRREDSIGHAGRLYDRLAARFGAENVYRDIDAAKAGEDFADAIRRRVEACDVLLVLIGPRWVKAADDTGGWRLAQESDWVRQEITLALARNVRVIPVLLEGAKMPAAGDLPAALAKLAQRNAVEIRDTHFEEDTAQLLDSLAPRWHHSRWLRKLARPIAWAVPALLLAVAAAVSVYISQVSLSPEQARARLAQLDIRYTADAFVQSVERGDAQAIDLFFKAGIDPNSEDRHGASALDWAAAKGQLDLMKRLIKRGAAADQALPWAAGRGQSEAVDLLLKNISGTPPALNKALISASGAGKDSVVRTLLDRGADVNFQDSGGFTPLMEASRKGNMETVRLLIARGADARRTSENKSWKGWTALHAVSDTSSSSMDDEKEKVFVEVARLLLEKGGDINARSLYVNQDQGGLWTPLLVASHNSRWAVARFLIERGADVNAGTGASDEFLDRTALMWAAENDNVAAATALLAKNANVNGRNKRGDTPLSFAARRQSLAVMDLLLVHGADPNMANEKGWTPLMNAASQGGAVTAKLIEKGANVNARTKAGSTALMIAAEQNERNAVDVLLSHGADVHAANDRGNTVLMAAAYGGNPDIVRLLLAKGANARAANIDGETALDVARKEKSDKVIAALTAALHSSQTRNARR
jgi:uncharacterized protein